MISLIVAASTNNVIGVQGELPWRISDDLKRFKALTTGKPIVMGRLTFESIGRALPERHNIVISRRPGYVADGCAVVASPGAALQEAGDADEVMIIGGGQVYELFLSKADRIYLTRVKTELDGDTHFPQIDIDSWNLLSLEKRSADDRNEFGFEFRTYQRR